MNIQEMTIIPDSRQFLSESMRPIFLGLAGMAIYPFLPAWANGTYTKMALTAAYLLLVIFLCVKFAVLKAYSWKVNNFEIRQKHGVLNKQTDYIELYRVVDYRETQSFLQRIFGVKTVVIISTDKSEPAMEIKGVPEKMELVAFTRKLVEQTKKENRIYEIANR